MGIGNGYGARCGPVAASRGSTPRPPRFVRSVEVDSEPPMHIHTRDDEFIYVLDGDLTAYVGDELLNAQAGDFVCMPRDVPHTFALDGTGRARALVMRTPSRFELVL